MSRQSRTQRALAFWSAGERPERLWDNGIESLFQLVMENKTKNLLQKLLTERLNDWLTIPYQETRKNPQNMQERSKCVSVL